MSHWGDAITYLGQTTLKQQSVQFGIKDSDRERHVCILGTQDSDRMKSAVTMALQDIERGLGCVFLDSTGEASVLLLERIDPKFHDRLVFVDPADAEHPYSWNIIDDVRRLPEERHVKELAQILATIYGIENRPLVERAAEQLLKEKDATVVTFFLLIHSSDARKVYFKTEDERAEFESLLEEDQETVAVIKEQGQYIARDSLIRNLFGQFESKFSVQGTESGQILVVDTSKIKMYPTRMAPLIRAFMHAAYIAGSISKYPLPLYLVDCLRYISTSDSDALFASTHTAVTVVDAGAVEGSHEQREQTVAQCGSILAFKTSPTERPILERTFYPYINPEVFFDMDTHEYATTLTIDSVRAKPFFAQTMDLPSLQNVSYQDVLVISRNRYTTPRIKVDALFRRKKDSQNPPTPPGGFSDTFRSMFAKRAQGAQGAQSPQPPPQSPTASSVSQPVAPVAARAPVPVSHKEVRPSEIPDHVLKQLIYVTPVS